jgi:hypothetical protein
MNERLRTPESRNSFGMQPRKGHKHFSIKLDAFRIMPAARVLFIQSAPSLSFADSERFEKVMIGFNRNIQEF